MLELLTDAVQIAQTAEPRDPEYAANLAEGIKLAAAALSVGLAAIAAGYAERQIGAAAVGAMAEDPAMFGRGLIMTVLPETLVIFAIIVIFLV
ncbi:MAG: hypothetical protein ACOC0X_05570 [Halobacteriota archaeon]